MEKPTRIDTQNTVSKWMTPQPVTLAEAQTLAEAIDLFTKHNYYGIPVTDSRGFLEGMVTKTTIMDALYSKHDNQTAVVDFMDSSLDVVFPLDPLEKALQMKEGCLPVVNENRKLVGIITRTDLLRAKRIQFDTVQHSLKAMTILQKVLDNTYEGFVVVDQSAHIVEINDAYCRILKKDREEVLGKPVVDIIENTRLHLILKNGNEERNRLQRINGHEMVVHRIPLLENGQVMGAIGLLIYHNIDNMYALATRYGTPTELEAHEKADYADQQLQAIIGSSSSTAQIKKRLKRIAPLPSNVLITGESGTGKELHARLIHQLSRVADGNFVAVNCSAIPESLLESELFGYEPGAFTGASENGKKGKFELAENGTIFLDEIGDMPLAMQAKLLRVLQEKTIDPVGATTSRKINVRIIAATNQKLSEKIAAKEFREDLFYRLNVLPLELQPLREHSADIPELIHYFLDRFATDFQLPLPELATNARRLLYNYTYPGNIRELANICEGLVGLCDDAIVNLNDLPSRITNLDTTELQQNQADLNSVKSLAEKELIRQTLQDHNGNKSAAARSLGIQRSTLYQKIRNLGI